VAPREVKIVPPDPTWPEAFQTEAATLAAIFGDRATAIHHIGSTSVPGLAAKLTIDILPEVRNIEEIDALNDAMADAGYEAWGEYGIPGRRFFPKNHGTARTHNVHIFQTGNPEVERHLAFKNYLIHHPETANAYAQLKQTLAQNHPTDIESYMDGKDAFVKRVEKQAMSWTNARKLEADKLKVEAKPERAERRDSAVLRAEAEGWSVRDDRREEPAC
jgi:GrpB-like predicted nucleotidyltransferase (UPF0157 family)